MSPHNKCQSIFSILSHFVCSSTDGSARAQPSLKRSLFSQKAFAMMRTHRRSPWQYHPLPEAWSHLQWFIVCWEIRKCAWNEQVRSRTREMSEINEITCFDATRVSCRRFILTSVPSILFIRFNTIRITNDCVDFYGFLCVVAFGLVVVAESWKVRSVAVDATLIYLYGEPVCSLSFVLYLSLLNSTTSDSLSLPLLLPFLVLLSLVDWFWLIVESIVLSAWCYYYNTTRIDYYFHDPCSFHDFLLFWFFLWFFLWSVLLLYSAIDLFSCSCCSVCHYLYTHKNYLTTWLDTH